MDTMQNSPVFPFNPQDIPTAMFVPEMTPPRIDSMPYITVVNDHPINGPEIVVYKTKKVKRLSERYVYGPLLGKGSYGEVKEGMDITSGRRVAVKIVQNKDIERAKAELTIQPRLSHPNVTELLDVIKVPEKDKTYMVFELLPYGDVAKMLRKMPNKCFPPALARALFNDLIEGLQYLHSKGIVHRDIKPANLMLAADGRLKIADFGVSHWGTQFDNELCDRSPGTLSYQPPEIVRPVNPLGSVYHLDIWAAGVTLYQMLYGAVPFDGEYEELTRNIQLAMLHFPTTHGPQPQQRQDNPGVGDIFAGDVIAEDGALVQNLLRCMLNREPANRLSLDEILQHEWMRAHNDTADDLRYLLFMSTLEKAGVKCETSVGSVDQWLEMVEDEDIVVPIM